MNPAKRTATLIGLLALAMLASGCGILQGSSQPAQEPARALSESISVSGFGEATGVPDIATVQLGVEVTAESIGEAIDLSNATVDRVTAALMGMGIAETDLQTTNFNTWPEDEYDRFTGQLTGRRLFHVDSTVRVVVRNIDHVSQVIQAGLDAGATTVWGLTFGIDDTRALEAEARAEALTDARDRAQQLADAVGFTLGDAIVVSELVGGGLTSFGFETVRGLGGGGGGPPLSPGELTVSIQVDVMYDVTR